jgi:hypothetical protein
MGLDAFVRCRCWEDGTYHPPPPIPAERIGVVDGSLEPLVDGEWRDFDRWKRTACAHPDMDAACEYLANWGGYRAFQQALRQVGTFPVMTEHLPNGNGGEMPAAISAQVLAELTYFDALPDVGTETVLLDEGSGEVVTTYIESYDGTYLSSATRAGVAPDGFFVVRHDKLMFRSTRFGYVDGMLVDGDQRVEWDFEPLPPRLRVETRLVGPAEFAYIVEPLRKVCQVSVETGNPVVWC